MLIWINGPFGGGKTHTAHELERRLAGSVICDPEHIGFGLHRTLPPDLRGDFQDLHSWRQGVVEVLDITLRRGRTVIAPMTVIEPRYFEETIGRLRERGHDVRHFALLAQRETVLDRLRQRGLGRVVQLVAGKDASLRRDSFAVANLDRCLEHLTGPAFAEHIWTDRLPIREVADQIATSSGLSLSPNTDSAIRAQLRKTWTGLRHIRTD